MCGFFYNGFSLPQCNLDDSSIHYFSVNLYCENMVRLLY